MCAHSKWEIQYSSWNVEVQGLLFGSWGFLPKFTYNILHNLDPTRYELQLILEQILEDSFHRLQYHLHFKN